jgi:hypothetical protein
MEKCPLTNSTPPLSPAAQAVLTALTQKEYGLDPADIPNEAWRMACIAAAALCVAADQVVPDEPNIPEGDLIQETCRWDERSGIRADLLAIAAELEQTTNTTETTP